MPVVERLRAGGSALWQRFSRRSSSNFKFAFLFLGAEQRRALERIYDYCRVVDDIVDERAPGAEGERAARAALAEWSREVERIFGDAYLDDDAPRTALGSDLKDLRRGFDFPREAFDEIVAGVTMDLEQARYADLPALRRYCYRVASCVGFLCIAVFGDQSAPARAYAEHLGLALQYTNILRDVAEDAARGRIYLPLDLLERHGLDTADVLEQCYDDRFVAAASEFAHEAEREYRLAWEHHLRVDRRRMLPAEIMGRTYHEVLEKIRERNFDVFTRRPALKRREKLRVAALAVARLGLPLPS